MQTESGNLYQHPSQQVIHWCGRISRQKWHSTFVEMPDASLIREYANLSIFLRLKGRNRSVISRGESHPMEFISTSSLRSLPFHRLYGHLVFPHTICPPITSLSNHISGTNLMEGPSETSWFRSHVCHPCDECVYVSSKSTLRWSTFSEDEVIWEASNLFYHKVEM